ncbi:MAG: MFS transporter [Gammaproteobacteria bacterium]|nr:MFS transporter [Gammaproteobacteria bacterium]
MAPKSHARWLVLLGVWVIYTAFGLVAASLAPLVKQIEHDLGMSHAQMGGVMGAWQLVYIVAALPCGVLLDRLGARWALLLGALCVAASAYWRGEATSFAGLAAAVMLFGVGGPIISAGAPKVIAQWFQGPSRGLAMGIYITGPALGGVACLTLTPAWLLPRFDNDWRFILSLWAGVTVAAGLVWLALASLPGVRDKTDERQSSSHEPHREVLMGLLRLPSVRLVLGMAVGVFMVSHGMSNWLPALLTHGGMPEVQAGYWSSVPTLVGILGSLTIPRLAVPERRFLILALLSSAILAASVLLQFTAPAALFPGLVLQGIARSTLTTVLMLSLVELPEVGARHAGVASGLFFGAGEIGGMLGPLILGVLYDWTHGFAAGLVLFTAVGAGLLAGAWRLRALA